MSAFTVVTLECDGCGATAQSKLQLAPTLLFIEPVEGWLIWPASPILPVMNTNHVNISSPLSSHILCPSCAVTEDSVRRLRASAEPSTFLATGSNLDVLADNLMGLARLPGETDQSLRGRIMKVVGPS